MTSAIRISAPARGSRAPRGAPRSRALSAASYGVGDGACDSGSGSAPERGGRVERAGDRRAVEAVGHRQPGQREQRRQDVDDVGAAAARRPARTPGPGEHEEPVAPVRAVHAGALPAAVLRGARRRSAGPGAVAPQARRAVAVDQRELEQQIGRALDGRPA